jgi:hypothetical protein
VPIVLTSYDDFPLHQASVPIALTATSDANHYDRYFFNGCSRDGSLYFALAMGLYPNRHVVDAAFCVVTGDDASGRTQTSVFASGRAPRDRRDATRVGPIRIEVVEPLRTLRVVVDAPDQGVRAERTFDRRSPALEEPHFFQRHGQRVFFDYTRLTQFGTWTGWIDLDGARIDVAPADTWAARDRSWGVRPVGEAAPLGAPTGDPQFFWLWAPVNFPTLSTHFDVNEHADGRRWHEFGAVAPEGDGEAFVARTVDWRVEWRPGTRWATSFEYDLVGWDERIATVRLTPRYEFQMRGIGYGHPTFRHGAWQGESTVAGERFATPVDNPTDPANLHIQAIVDATYTSPDGEVEEGIGILEQMAIGPHPTGLTGLTDGFAT